MKKEHWQFALRIVLTVVAWVLIVLYFHKLGHQYLGDIKSYLDAPAAQLVLQILLIAGLVYLVLLSLPGIAAPGRRGIITIVVWAILLAVGHQVSHTGLHEIQTALLLESSALNWISIALVSILYMIILSLPFVPAIELGILIMVIFGLPGVIVAYAATVGGLSIAFTAARFLPSSIRGKWMAKLNIDVDKSRADGAMSTLITGGQYKPKFSESMKSYLLKNRYLMLALSLNLPGNSAIGGGGGIAFICGASGMFRWGSFLTTVLLATAPIPVLVSVGFIELQPLLEKHGFLHQMFRYLESFITH